MGVSLRGAGEKPGAHPHRIIPLSLWNAAAAGLDAASIVGGLERFGKYELPGNVRADIVDAVARDGRVKLVQEGQHLLLVSEDRPLLVEIERHKHIAPCLIGRHLSGGLLVDPAQRGRIKQALLQFGYPAEDGPAGGAAGSRPGGGWISTGDDAQPAAGGGAGPGRRRHPGLPGAVPRWTAAGRGRAAGALAAVTLLQVESAAVLTDLLADPEVSPHVRRLEGAATVAVVQGAGIEQVRSALQARGMELADHPL